MSGQGKPEASMSISSETMSMYICQCIHFIYKYKNLYKPYEFEVRSITPKEPHILGTKSWGVTSVTQKTRQLVASIVKLAETETTFARSIR